MLQIGLDAGGTSTRATVVTTDGECVGYARSSGGNPISSGKIGASSAILDAIESALTRANATLSDVSVIVAAMAGGSADDSRDWLIEPLADRDFTGTVAWESDLLATYFSGTFSSFGYAIVSGTGAAVIRVEDGQIARTSDGLGWLLGDAGSGFWIGHNVALAVMSDIDGRGPSTALTPRLLEALGISTEGARVQGRSPALPRLITALYDMRPVQLAQFAPLAFSEPEDAVSRGILESAGSLLAHSVEAVHTENGPLVIGGSVLAQTGRLAETFAARLAAQGIEPAIVRVADGAVGSAVLALREAGVDITASVFRRVTDSVARMR
ncbi:N-acetylglucosamine kinase [Paramicrobacterium agarici]|uniref:N-acetylglucosamine kinase-like BadF-type ATPase n=1 Tax=Paramicrobacterium agarici TaxID=630514 RepID=A0A2A9DRA4_9MICO|nr:BadF/BadG/BcrA/BcrD ATPase family protein [Microbacterium agarici]PFG29124.1 N-acetylglucosamine kinase-like BadF-type ATPase [Microbacterium agarici]